MAKEIKKGAPKKKTSAQKRHEQSIRRNLKNRARKSEIKTLMKNFEEKPSTESMSLLAQALDKAAKTSVIHRNKASRLKSKIAKKLATKKA